MENNETLTQEQSFEEVLDTALAKGKVILEELKAINAKKTIYS